MRWLLRKSVDGAQARTIITAGRTRREMIAAGLAYLATHPNEQRCYATDTRSGTTVPVTRRNRPRKRQRGGKAA